MTEQLYNHFQTILSEVADHCQVAEGVLDLDIYRVQIALFWIQVAVSPANVQATEADLEKLYEYTNRAVARWLGDDEDLKTIFRFLKTAAGDVMMNKLRIANYQRDLLDYFGTLINDPEEHKRRMASAREEIKNKSY